MAVSNLSVLERAYQLARAGCATNIGEIKKILRDEGYFNVDGHLAGPALAKDLRDLCKAALSSARRPSR